MYVGGSAGTTDGMAMYHNGNNSFFINNNRTFYIGQNTTASGFPLYVHAGSEFYLKHYHSNGGQNSVIKSIRGGAFTLYHAAPNVPSAEHVRLETTSTGINFPRNIDVEGNLTVGVGGTTITTVVGAAASVGIGDASPSYMLDVAGAINSQTDVKVNGVSVTEQALNDAVAMAIALG